MTSINEIEQGGFYKPTFYLPTPSRKLNALLDGSGVQSNAIIQYMSKDEGSFKTTLALQMLAEAQRMGLDVGFVDAEMAMNMNWAESIGVDTSRWYYTQPTSGEKGFELVYNMIEDLNCKVVVLDSIDSLQPEYMHTSDLGDASIGNMAKLHSKAIRRLLPIIAKHNAIVIGINQMRVNLTQMGARGYNAGGGRGWGFYSKLIIDCKKPTANASKDKEFIDLDLFVAKNKMGRSYDTIKVKCQQGIGAIPEYDILEEMLLGGDLEKKGAWYRYKGEPVAQGEDSAIQWIRENHV